MLAPRKPAMPSGFCPDGTRNANSSPFDTFDVGECQLRTVRKDDSSRRIGRKFQMVLFRIGDFTFIKDQGPVTRVDFAATYAVQFDGVRGPSIGPTINIVIAYAHVKDERRRNSYRHRRQRECRSHRRQRSCHCPKCRGWSRHRPHPRLCFYRRQHRYCHSHRQH